MTRRVALFAEVDMNLLDGSAVWLQSVGLMLSALDDVDVTLVLRAPERRALLLEPLREADVELHVPRVRLDVPGALETIRRLDERHRFDAVIVRGTATALALSETGWIDGRLWFYYVPPHGEPVGSDATTLRPIGTVAHRVLCQTEAIRARVEATVPEASRRLVLLPPMVPDVGADPPPTTGAVRRLFYAGKFSPEYAAVEMFDLLARVRRELPEVELHVAGDKIHNPPADPTFAPTVSHLLATQEGVRWHGPVSRDRVAELCRSCDVALSLRHPSMDVSGEMSTKVLEYGAQARPVLLNRNALHMALLGTDYPLLASDAEEAAAVLASADADALRDAATRCSLLSREHSFSRVGPRIGRHLARAPRAREDGGRRLLMAAHDWQFVRPILGVAERNGVEVVMDRWQAHTVPSDAPPRLEGSDTVFCEWCLGNAVHYSHKVARDQRLVVRFHRMEIQTDHPRKVDLDRVDAMVFVAEHVRDAAVARYGWPASSPRLRVVPNAIDLEGMDRPKLPGAAFTLGMVGWVPSLKRLDRALDILELLRADDDRYRLVVKGRPPWAYGWLHSRLDQRAVYTDLLRRIRRSPLLRDAVQLEGWSPLVSAFFQKVGVILSLSDVEGHAVGAAEGMAARCAPVVFDRPGARAQYPAEWVVGSAAEGAALVRSHTADPTAGERARAYAGRWNHDAVEAEWASILGFAV